MCSFCLFDSILGFTFLCHHLFFMAGFFVFLFSPFYISSCFVSSFLCVCASVGFDFQVNFSLSSFLRARIVLDFIISALYFESLVRKMVHHDARFCDLVSSHLFFVYLFNFSPMPLSCVVCHVFQFVPSFFFFCLLVVDDFFKPDFLLRSLSVLS